MLHRQSPVSHYTTVDASIKEVASWIIDSFITCKPVSSQLSLTECMLKSLMGCSDWGFGDNGAVVPTWPAWCDSFLSNVMHIPSTTDPVSAFLWWDVSGVHGLIVHTVYLKNLECCTFQKHSGNLSSGLNSVCICSNASSNCKHVWLFSLVSTVVTVTFIKVREFAYHHIMES